MTRRGLFAPALGLVAAACSPLSSPALSPLGLLNSPGRTTVSKEANQIAATINKEAIKLR